MEDFIHFKKVAEVCRDVGGYYDPCKLNFYSIKNETIFSIINNKIISDIFLLLLQYYVLKIKLFLKSK